MAQPIMDFDTSSLAPIMHNFSTAPTKSSGVLHRPTCATRTYASSGLKKAKTQLGMIG